MQILDNVQCVTIVSFKVRKVTLIQVISLKFTISTLQNSDEGKSAVVQGCNTMRDMQKCSYARLSILWAKTLLLELVWTDGRIDHLPCTGTNSIPCNPSKLMMAC